jgi:recombination protein RecA
MGVAHGIIEKSGAFFSYGGERLGQGRNNAKAFLKENQQLASAILGETLHAAGVTATEGIEEIAPEAEEAPAKA